MTKKVLVIFGTYIDTSSNAYIYDRHFDAKILSFYKPTLTGNINKKNTITFNETKKPFSFLPFLFLIRTYKLMKIIKKHNIQSVISQFDQANISVLPLLFISRLLKKQTKFYAFLRSGDAEYDTKNFEAKYLSFFIKHFYNYFDKVITVSKGNMLLIQKRFKLKNMDYIYNAVSANYAKKRAKQDINIQKYTNIKDPFIFISLGRLKEQKANWYLLRTFKEVVNKNKNCILFILGRGGHEKPMLKLIKDLNLQNNVFLPGYQKNIYPFIKQAHCFVGTALWESFGHVITESLALNKLVVYTDTKGPREILAPSLPVGKKITYPYYGKYGILTKPFKRQYVWKTLSQKPLDKSEQILANLLLKISKDKSIKQQYKQVEKRAQDFDIKKIAEVIEQKLNLT